MDEVKKPWTVRDPLVQYPWVQEVFKPVLVVEKDMPDWSTVPSK